MTKKADYVNIRNYNDYTQFINECKRKIYHESLVLHKHHVTPKCMWFDEENCVNSEINLVELSVEDHIKAHLLLAYCFEEGTYEYNANLRSARILNKKSIKDKSTLDKISECYTGKNNPFYGKKHSDEVLKNLANKASQQFKGLSYEQIYGSRSDEQRKKRSEGVSNSWKNMTNEDRANRSKKCSEALKGKLKGLKNPMSIQLYVDGVFYGSISEACRAFGYTKPHKLYKYHNVIKINK